MLYMKCIVHLKWKTFLVGNSLHTTDDAQTEEFFTKIRNKSNFHMNEPVTQRNDRKNYI